MSINQLGVRELQHWRQQQRPFLLLDVREEEEFAYARIDGSQHIPLRQLPEKWQGLPGDLDIAVLCHHGIRSQQACVFLEQYGFERLYNVQGGIDAWSVHCDPNVLRY